MKLYTSGTSPYARKVRMVVIEKELRDRVEVVAVNPMTDDPALMAANPLGKVPALVTDDGTTIFDSPVICAYLDEVGGAPPLLPLGTGRWQALTADALTDGVMDAAFATVMELRRPAAQRSEMWMERWLRAVVRSLDAVEADFGAYEGPVSLAQIGLGAALGYLDFRLANLAWRDERPTTAAWYAAFSARPAMLETRPEDAA